MFLGYRRQRFTERPVNAVLHADFRVAGLNVDIAGSPLESCKDDGIDEADDWARFFLGDLLDRDCLFTGFILADQSQLEPLGRFVQHALR